MNKLLLALGTVALLGSSAYLFTAPAGKLAVGLTQEKVNDFSAWKHKFGRKYGSADLETYRISVFLDNKDYIEEINASGETYTLGENQFMDLTKEEFAATYLTLFSDRKVSEKSIKPIENLQAVDWTSQVSPVKNQGSCGSCWAFAAVAAIEAIGRIEGTATGTYSEQQLVDCSRLQGNLGCQGGLMDAAYRYIIKNGLATDSQYPYKAKNQLCAFNGGDLNIGDYDNVKAGDCQDLAAKLVERPISVAVDASNWSFYKSGVFSNCGDALNHGVLLTAVDNSGVWTIKNSWGTAWGETGFIKLAPGDTCGLCDDASYPLDVSS